MLILQSTTVKVPIMLVDGSGAAVTGVSFSQATVYLQKQGGASTAKTLSSGDWVEVDSTNFAGVYDLQLSGTDTNTLGFLKVSAKSSGSLYAFALFEVRAHTADDVYSLIGTPSSGTVSGDIAVVRAAHVALSTTAASGSTSTVVRSGATQASNFFNGMALLAINAAGVACRVIESYSNTNGAFTLSSALPFTPSNGDTLYVLASNPAGIWDVLRSNHTASGSFGEGAASVQGNVTGSVGSVTGNVGGNVTGSTGSVVGNVGGNLVGNVNGNVVGSVGSVTGAVGSVTGNVGGNVVGNVNGNVVGSVGSVTGAVGSVTGNLGGNVNGNVVGSVGSVTGSVGSVVSNVGGNVSGSVGSVVGNVGGNVVGSVSSVSGNVGGNVTGSVGSVASGGISASSFAADAISATALSTAAADKVRDTILSDSTPFPGSNLVWPTGTVVTDAGNSATTFKTNRTETTNDYWVDALVEFTSGALAGQVKKIGAYDGTTKFITLASGKTFTGTPSGGDTFNLINK